MKTKIDKLEITRLPYGGYKVAVWSNGETKFGIAGGAASTIMRLTDLMFSNEASEIEPANPAEWTYEKV